MQYIRMTKLVEQRRLQRYANRDNGHRPTRAENPLRKAVRESTERVQTAYARLLRALDEALQ